MKSILKNLATTAAAKAVLTQDNVSGLIGLIMFSTVSKSELIAAANACIVPALATTTAGTPAVTTTKKGAYKTYASDMNKMVGSAEATFKLAVKGNEIAKKNLIKSASKADKAILKEIFKELGVANAPKPEKKAEKVGFISKLFNDSEEPKNKEKKVKEVAKAEKKKKKETTKKSKKLSNFYA